MRLIEEFEGLVSSQLSIIKTCLTITKLEARLATMNLIPLLISLCMLFVSLIGSWLMATGLLCYAFTQILDNVMVSVLIVFLLNVIGFGVFAKCVLSNLRKMSFEKTRQYLSSTKQEA